MVSMRLPELLEDVISIQKKRDFPTGGYSVWDCPPPKEPKPPTPAKIETEKKDVSELPKP